MCHTSERITVVPLHYPPPSATIPSTLQGPRMPLHGLHKIKQQKSVLFTSFYYSPRVFSRYMHIFGCDSIIVLICYVLLHSYHQIANFVKKIKKNSLNLATVASMSQKVMGARHPWHPSLRGSCD